MKVKYECPPNLLTLLEMCTPHDFHCILNIYLPEWPTGLDLHQQKVKSHDNLINAPFREFHQLSRAKVFNSNCG